MRTTVAIKFSIFTSASVKEFISLAGAVKNALVERSDFFNAPPIVPSVLATDIAALIEINNTAESNDGSHNNRNERQGLRDAIYQKLVLNGIYVLSLANGKESYSDKKAIVEMAAYPVAFDSKNPVEPVPVTGLKVSASIIPGIRLVSARWKRGKCNTFIVEGTQGEVSSPSTEWTQLLLCTKANCELTLDAGKWAVRVIGVYRSGEAAPSDPVIFMVS